MGQLTKQLGRLLIASPKTAKICQMCMAKYAFTIGSIHHLKYDSPIPILATISIDPAEITHEVHSRLGNSKYPKVIGGNWDQDPAPLHNRIEFQSFENHFENDVPWPNTELYQQHLETVGEEKSRYSSQADLDRRCAYWDELYNRIKESGYKSQRELMGNDWIDPLDSKITINYPEYREIQISIGRNGEMLFMDGLHRLCIAKIVGCESIPVWVGYRHKQWQSKREDIYKNEEIKRDETEHPDLVWVADRK